MGAPPRAAGISAEDHGDQTAASEPTGDDGLDLRSGLRLVLQPPLGLCLSPDGLLEWPHEFMPFQVRGIRLLFERDRLLLADDMEREGWWRAPAHAYLAGYETLRADLALVRSRLWDLVIIDEAQRIKSAGAEVAGAVKELRRRRALALTGTPLETRLGDVVSILEFVRPRLDDVVAVESGIPLREQLAAVQLRRRKAEVLTELPAKMESELLLPMPTEQHAAYERAEREGRMQLRAQGPALRIASVLDLIVQLKQAV